MTPAGIELCLGSSCHARGSGGFPRVVQDFLAARGLAVPLRGKRCGQDCAHGPCVMIDGIRYTVRDAGELRQVLERAFS